ncbi:hypothetical protein ACLM5J_09525 [Nocardioides sp. Bht2]|uniref:hypothetical protein n=1 Tax=Nocardioides sp. Bht2 TaxID=3392297 RepID=UPI0039B50332
MNVDDLLRSWPVEALRQLGSPASRVEVARWVWTHHEATLRSSDELLYTWQLELRARTESLIGEGVIRTIGADHLALTDPAARARHRTGWLIEEIEATVRAYLRLLIAENGGAAASRPQVIAELLDATDRSVDQLEPLLCNVSAVVQEHGFQPLAQYRPRSNVPRGVRDAVADELTRLDLG